MAVVIITAGAVGIAQHYVNGDKIRQRANADAIQNRNRWSDCQKLAKLIYPGRRPPTPNLLKILSQDTVPRFSDFAALRKIFLEANHGSATRAEFLQIQSKKFPLVCGPLQTLRPPPQLRVLRGPKHGTYRTKGYAGKWGNIGHIVVLYLFTMFAYRSDLFTDSHVYWLKIRGFAPRCAILSFKMRFISNPFYLPKFDKLDLEFLAKTLNSGMLDSKNNPQSSS